LSDLLGKSIKRMAFPHTGLIYYAFKQTKR